MKAIDFALKGNVARIYLGMDDLRHWWGDDWDDVPYDPNAGKVYEEFVAGHVDVAFPYDAIVLEPSDGELNSPWSKEDMRMGRVPMFAVLSHPGEDAWKYGCSFSRIVGDASVWLCRMGEPFDEGGLPDGAVVLQTSIKTDEERLAEQRENALRHLRWTQRMGDDGIDYSDRLAYALFRNGSADGLTCSDVTRRIMELIDSPANQEVTESLRHAIGAPSLVYPSELCRALFGDGATHECEEVTARLIELIEVASREA